MESAVSDVWTTLGGMLHLQGSAVAKSVLLPHAPQFAAGVVAVAGLSEAVGQSVVLFVNKVKPARFVLSLLVSAMLFVVSYAFLIASTWLMMALSRHAHVSFAELAVVMAFTAVPLAFSFLSALPYFGVPLLWVLRTWHLLILVIGVATVAGVALADALLYTALGWVFKAVAEQTLGNSIARLGSKALDLAAGVELRDEGKIDLDALQVSAPPSGASTLARKRAAQSYVTAFGGLAFMGTVAYAVALALHPLRHTVLGWQGHLPEALQIPLDLVWIGIVGLIVGALMAPVETLEWWAGWYGDGVAPARVRPPSSSVAHPSHYVVYLDGISQSSSRYTPDIETFLDALAPQLPPGMRLLRGIMSYSVINRPLDDDPILARFWQFIDALRFGNRAGLLGMIVNLRNVLIVAVSADKRYGPLYNHGIAQIIFDALAEDGYALGERTPLTLIGYSGGGQMSAAAAPILRRALSAPVEVISLGGVMSGSCHFLQFDRLYQLVGTKDRVEPLGPIMFPSRWKIAYLSDWNRAVRAGKLVWISLGPVGHQVPGGMLDPQHRLADGRTNLQSTIDEILTILRGKGPPDSAPATPRSGRESKNP